MQKIRGFQKLFLDEGGGGYPQNSDIRIGLSRVFPSEHVHILQWLWT